MSATFTNTTTFEVYGCCHCRMQFGLSAEFVVARRRDHEWWYCPQGHLQHFTGKTEAERLKVELEREQQRRQAAEANARWQAERKDAARRSNAALRGVQTRIKNRIAKGQCPCCSKTFADLASHMSGQHPEFAEATP